MIHTMVSPWYLLAIAATFLGVGVLSNTNVKIAGYSLVPIADTFVSIKAKVSEQAAEDKANAVVRAQLIERLQKLPIHTIEAVHRAGLIGAHKDAQKEAERALKKSDGKRDERYKSLLIGRLVRINLPYVEQRIDAWENAPP